jgi:hypothetical protein
VLASVGAGQPPWDHQSRVGEAGTGDLAVNASQNEGVGLGSNTVARGIHRSSSPRVSSANAVVERHDRRFGVGCGDDGPFAGVKGQKPRAPVTAPHSCGAEGRPSPRWSRAVTVEERVSGLPDAHRRGTFTRTYRETSRRRWRWLERVDFGQRPSLGMAGLRSSRRRKGATLEPVDVRWFERFQCLFGSTGANRGDGNIVAELDAPRGRISVVSSLCL